MLCLLVYHAPVLTESRRFGIGQGRGRVRLPPWSCVWFWTCNAGAPPCLYVPATTRLLFAFSDLQVAWLFQLFGQERKSCWRFFSFLNGEQCMLRPSCIRNVENFVRPGDCGSWLMSLPMLAYLNICAVMSGRTLPGSRWVVNSCR